MPSDRLRLPRSLLFAAGPVVAGLLVCFAGALACGSDSPPPYQATGFKVGEVSDSGAIVWTRLTAKPDRNPPDGPQTELVRRDADSNKQRGEVRLPDGLTVGDLREAAPGAEGEVRVAYRIEGETSWQFSDWEAVDPERDFTRQIPLSRLRPNARYELRVESRAVAAGPAGQSLDGRFRTAPAPDRPAPVSFTVSTGQGYPSRDCPEGYKIYSQMLELQPDFFVHTGDIVYYDNASVPHDWAVTIELARYHWWRTYSLPSNVQFHRQVASYFIKDDHDTLQDDCWPTMASKMGELTFRQGQEVFVEQVPMGKSTVRTYRWGKDLQIWLVEGRDFRSPNPDPDGPEKTIWGQEQKAWFKQTVQASDATFRVLISPTPLVGPDRANKRDNHANKAFTHEGDELRRFIAEQKNMVVVCGDRHWQYHSIHPQTGVREYSCGPVSDKHAGGWSQKDFVADYHRYLNVIGGFLSAAVQRQDGQPVLTFRFYDVEGNVKYEDRLVAE